MPKTKHLTIEEYESGEWHDVTTHGDLAEGKMVVIPVWTPPLPEIPDDGMAYEVKHGRLCKIIRGD